jgi:hypothetical protein
VLLHYQIEGALGNGDGLLPERFPSLALPRSGSRVFLTRPSISSGGQDP